ncbi:MAG: hypothetical protein KME35_17885 [Aphanocapsa sp. GSE-SYN-MK-11-07L]|jgi:hypothetical protein|nr:hypothetical protein [Aphanocapsa sp. GSE-SYN-MK-11-07L]
MAKTIAPKQQFMFVGSAVLEARLDLRKTQRVELQKQLPCPLYWFQFPGGRKVFWNWELVQDYLINGDGPNHQRLVEQYLATLPNPAA